jgi:competence protein ComEC
MVRAVVVYFLATLASTTIAGLATAPYTAYHFHRVARYGSVGNVIAIPLASLWIMPWLVVALLLMPFGGDWIAYAPLKLGLHGVEVAARAVSSWPGAALSVPLVPTSVLVVLTLAGLWLAIWRQSWRHWAWPVIFVCVAIPWFLKPPDFIITGDGGVMAGQGQHGLVFSPGTSQAFVREQWQEMWGLDEKAGAALSSAPLTCTSAGCQYRTNSGFLIAVPRSSSARADACQQAAAVVDLSRQMILKADAPPCTAPWTMDATPLKDSGALMLSIDASGHVTAATVSEARGQRPWVTPP